MGVFILLGIQMKILDVKGKDLTANEKEKSYYLPFSKLWSCREQNNFKGDHNTSRIAGCYFYRRYLLAEFPLSFKILGN